MHNVSATDSSSPDASSSYAARYAANISPPQLGHTTTCFAYPVPTVHSQRGALVHHHISLDLLGGQSPFKLIAPSVHQVQPAPDLSETQSGDLYNITDTKYPSSTICTIHINCHETTALSYRYSTITEGVTSNQHDMILEEFSDVQFEVLEMLQRTATKHSPSRPQICEAILRHRR